MRQTGETDRTIGLRDRDRAYLVVEVVEIAGYKHMDVPHDLQHIQSLARAKGHLGQDSIK